MCKMTEGSNITVVKCLSKGLYHKGIKLGTGIRCNLCNSGASGHPLLIRSLMDNGIIGIGHGDDPGDERDFISLKTFRIA